MITIERASEIINEKIDTLDFPDEPSALYEPMKYILSGGGKRIRPALLLLSCSIFSDDISVAIQPALGIEIFHNFSLVHDDIMDNSPTRRNKPTVHTRWNTNIALLSGDGMLIKAYENLSMTDKEIVGEVLDVFSKAAIEVCEGQQLDMNFEAMETVSESEYIRMIELKTSVLIAASLQIGAIIGRADRLSAAKLYEFGRNMGIAFQLQDDLMDVYADAETFGKRIGGDIISNKKTFLLIKALEVARGEDRIQLKKQLELKNFNPDEKIKAVTSIFNLYKIKELTQTKINRYFMAALRNLEELNIPKEKKTELEKFAMLLKGREK